MDTQETKVFEIGKRGRLKVNDSTQFIRLLSGTDKEYYNTLFKYAKKQLALKAKDVPQSEQPSLINMAIVKLSIGYDVDSGANLLTYFSYKLDGEISDYRNKVESLGKKIHKMVNEVTSMNENESHAYVFDNESGQNTLDKITNETPETILLAEDLYFRKLQAFRMAYSGIPKLSQDILNECVTSDLKLEDIAAERDMTKTELEKIRNSALSLILSRVLRSNHLTEEEKIEIKKEHGLISIAEEFDLEEMKKEALAKGL